MFTKNSLKRKFKIILLPLIYKWILTLIGISCRKIFVGREQLEKLEQNRQNWIYSTWHNNISLNSWSLRNQNLVSMVSSSADGSFAASVLEMMGHKTIRGSSSRGGAKVMLSMIKEIRSGSIGAITPDGPRGPKYHLQSGIISIAQKSGVPLVPLHVEATRQWVFEKSWDKHKFPKPFSTIVVCIGPPFLVSPKLNSDEFEEVRQEFESIMHQNVNLTKTIICQNRKRK